MKLRVVSLLTLSLSLLLALAGKAGAQFSPQLQESTVRIICPEPAENNGKGFNAITIELHNGETANLVSYSMGTGFVINNDGVIVTNNHVAAPEPLKETPNPLVMVMQKVGNHYILHHAGVLWQSANGDLAVIQAPQLKATALPLQFDENKSQPGDEVYSMGFPGITDVAEDDSARSKEVTVQFLNIRLNRRIQNMENQLHRALKPAEIEAVKQKMMEDFELLPTDWMDVLAALDAFLKNADGNALSWDVTDAINHKSLWGDYFKPTVTKGNIERIAKIHGFLGITYPDVLMIQHSCAIKHGNSGGPLLNAGGQVIGVVGRGRFHVKKGEREAVSWATAAGELKNWLDLHNVPYTAAGEWKKPEAEPVKIIERQPVQEVIQQPTVKIVERLPKKLIVAIGLAVILALVVSALGFLKFRQRPGFTTILRDPRMAKVLGTTHSKLLAADKGNSNRSPVAAPPGFGRWQLAGATPAGSSVSVEMTDVMFASNDNRLILGRIAELCHLVVNDSSISKQHAQIRKEGSQFMVADRNSSNHTAVNGQFNIKVFEEVPMQEGDTLTLGDVKLEFRRL